MQLPQVNIHQTYYFFFTFKAINLLISLLKFSTLFFTVEIIQAEEVNEIEEISESDDFYKEFSNSDEIESNKRKRHRHHHRHHNGDIFCHIEECVESCHKKGFKSGFCIKQIDNKCTCCNQCNTDVESVNSAPAPAPFANEVVDAMNYDELVDEDGE